MKGWLRGVRAMTDSVSGGRISPNATKVLEALSRNLNMPEDILKAFYVNAVNVNGDLSRASITKDYTFFRSKGWVTDPVDLDKVIDLSFAKEADRLLGPYVARK